MSVTRLVYTYCPHGRYTYYPYGIQGIWYLVHGSKHSLTVFLRHIAPERAREDQNLTMGPHFSAGHAQWRYALQVKACHLRRVYLAVICVSTFIALSTK